MNTNLNQMGKTLTQNTNSLKGAVEVGVTELATFTGVSKRTLQRIEAARRARRTYRPMLKTAVKLAAAAGVTVDDYINSRLQFQ
jgi:transcriptional regulator with XRE-family HTH domain